MKVLQRWLRGLWAWWAISAMLVLGMTMAGFYFSLIAFWTQTDANLEPKIHALKAAFSAVSDRQSAIVLDLRKDVMANRLSRTRLETVRQSAAPFFTVYYVRSDGRPVLPGDTLSSPAWMVAKAISLQVGTMQTFRPLPPGMDLALPGPGTSSAIVEAAPPRDFLTAALRGPDGPAADPSAPAGSGCGSGSPSYVFADADLDYLFGSWLAAQCRLIDFGTATVRRIDHEVLWKAPRPTKDDDLNGNINVQLSVRKTQWTRQVTVLPTGNLWPFDAVEMEMDVGPDLVVMRRSWALVAAGCACVLGGFAVSLWLAGAAIAKDFAAAHIRANFTAMVSHELRTPVAAICLTTEILEHKLVDDPQKIDEYHTLLHREALRLKRLIENVMRLLGLGGLAALESLPVGPVVEQAVEEATEGEGLKLEIPSTLSNAQMDREAAVRAVANLVQNALKYGGNRSDVMLTVHEDRRHVFVDVMDRGPGIARKLRQAVFEPYFRIQDEDRREKPGSGLGLALVKVLMERQTGRVSIHDRPGGGSIFRLAFRRS